MPIIRRVTVMYLAVVAVTALGFLVTSAQADPQKFTLTSRPNRSRYQARAKLGPSTVPLDDFFLNTDLQYVFKFWISFVFSNFYPC